MTTEVVNYGRTVVRADNSPVSAPVNYQEQQRQTPSDRNPATFAARRELAHYVEKHCDADGYITDAAVLAVGNGLLSSGYTLPQGVAVHAVEAFHTLAIAREAGIPQQYVTAFFEAIGRRQR